MSFDVLLQGKLRGQLTKGTASNGNAYGRFKLGLTDQNGEGVLAGCITFVAAAMTPYHAARKRGDKPAQGVADGI